MVAEYACPDDGKSDGHGEYLPRKAAGIKVPGHTATPEECIAQGPPPFEPACQTFSVALMLNEVNVFCSDF